MCIVMEQHHAAVELERAEIEAQRLFHELMSAVRNVPAVATRFEAWSKAADRALEARRALRARP